MALCEFLVDALYLALEDGQVGEYNLKFTRVLANQKRDAVLLDEPET